MQAGSSKAVVNVRQRKQQLASKFLKHGDEEELTFTFNNYYQYSHVKTFAHNRRLVEAKRIEAIIDYQLEYSFTFHEVLADCQWKLPDLSLAQSKRRSAMMKQNLTRRMMDGVIAELKLLNGDNNQAATAEPPIEFAESDEPAANNYSPISDADQQQAQDVYYQDWLVFKELVFAKDSTTNADNLLCHEQLDSASPPFTQLTTVPSTQQTRRRLFVNSPSPHDVELDEPPVPVTASTPTDWDAAGEVEGMTTDEIDSDCQLIEQFDSPAPAQASVEQSTLLSTAGGADDDDNLLDNLEDSYNAARQKYLRACGCWGEARRKVSNLKWAINKQSIKHTPLSTKELMCDRLFRYKLILKQRKRDYETASAEWEAMKFTYSALGYTDEDTAARRAFDDASAASASLLLGL